MRAGGACHWSGRRLRAVPLVDPTGRPIGPAPAHAPCDPLAAPMSALLRRSTLRHSACARCARVDGRA
eukprot:5976035-Alexandrium_andersonii.AAC.1